LHGIQDRSHSFLGGMLLNLESFGQRGRSYISHWSLVRQQQHFYQERVIYTSQRMKLFTLVIIFSILLIQVYCADKDIAQESEQEDHPCGRLANCLRKGRRNPHYKTTCQMIYDDVSPMVSSTWDRNLARHHASFMEAYPSSHEKTARGTKELLKLIAPYYPYISVVQQYIVVFFAFVTGYVIFGTNLVGHAFYRDVFFHVLVYLALACNDSVFMSLGLLDYSQFIKDPSALELFFFHLLEYSVVTSISFAVDKVLYCYYYIFIAEYYLARMFVSRIEHDKIVCTSTILFALFNQTILFFISAYYVAESVFKDLASSFFSLQSLCGIFMAFICATLADNYVPIVTNVYHHHRKLHKKQD
jgi:hypothetical protein